MLAGLLKLSTFLVVVVVAQTRESESKHELLKGMKMRRKAVFMWLNFLNASSRNL